MPEKKKIIQGVFGSSLETEQLKKEVAGLKAQLKGLIEWLVSKDILKVYKDGSFHDGAIEIDGIEPYDDSDLIARIEKLEAK